MSGDKTFDAAAGIGAKHSAAVDWGMFALLMTALREALGPISLNLERAYGGLADAFGLTPSRALHDAGRELTDALLARQHAQAEYMGLVIASLASAAGTMQERLAEMGRNGESIDSLLSLVRLSARTAEEALHRDLQATPGLEASARMLRAAVHAREAQQRMVAIASEALNVPTRAEVDEAYREIQELKRELRRLKKAMRPALPSADGAPVPAPGPKAVARRPRMPAAKRSKIAKVDAS